MRRDPFAPAAREKASPTALDSADPVRNFSLTTDERVRALTIGVPAWAARKRTIEDEEERLVIQLLEVHDKLTAKGQSRKTVELAIETAANALDLVKLNTLVKAHNRYYPVEANLPMDRRTGRYLVYGSPWEPEEPYTPARLLSMVRAALETRDDDRRAG
ncbi:MAG TPA: hypothetical protein VM580_19595 [Labilithrix sp.]|nr:hypothetical protein [Labilithrix sp.]